MVHYLSVQANGDGSLSFYTSMQMVYCLFVQARDGLLSFCSSKRWFIVFLSKHAHIGHSRDGWLVEASCSVDTGVSVQKVYTADTNLSMAPVPDVAVDLFSGGR